MTTSSRRDCSAIHLPPLQMAAAIEQAPMSKARGGAANRCHRHSGVEEHAGNLDCLLVLALIPGDASRQYEDGAVPLRKLIQEPGRAECESRPCSSPALLLSPRSGSGRFPDFSETEDCLSPLSHSLLPNQIGCRIHKDVHIAVSFMISISSS